ncbi:MAG: lysoplasmalogenase family protein [Gemmatimonas sp.]|uniref:lysoplasmalogenase family protein n=1 Tax=Gemmatimonas sp. TaxID=1962908 RepID=UPI00391EE932
MTLPVAAALVVTGALAAIVSASLGEAWRPVHYVAKPASTAVLLWLAATLSPGPPARFRLFIVTGLAWSLVGDVLLMLPGNLFVGGLMAFLIAHGCFLAAFLCESRFGGRPVAYAGYAALAGTLLLQLFPALPPALRLPVVGYVVVLTAMAAQAASWMLEDGSPASRLAATGAAWFVVSDATLAIDRFRVDLPLRDLAVLGTYWFALWCMARCVQRRVGRTLAVGLAATAVSLGSARIVAAQSPVPASAPASVPAAVAALVPPTQPRLLRAGDVDTLPVRRPGLRIAYGTDSLQFGELRLPETPGRRVPLVVFVHGGCWYSPYATVRNTAPLADALTDAGVATWNVEYRRYDHPGGGWPGTFRDVADAADYVRTLARLHPIDTTRIVLAGHSAGAHLVLWLATRRGLPPDSPLAGGTPLPIAAVVAIGGIADLREFYPRERATCGNPAVESLLGGVPDSVPARVQAASPIERLPLGVPSVHVAGDRDRIAPLAVREAFAEAARRAGDTADAVTVSGGHFEAIAPRTDAGARVVQLILARLGMAAAGR